MDKNKPIVGLIMGSKSDLPVLESTISKLKELGVSFEVKVISAHRTPDRAVQYSVSAKSRGIKVIIAAAGGAAHLAGFIAGHTILPVIGIPIDATPLSGMDSLLATVQMPGGIPVATVAIGKAGAVNAAILSAQIIAVGDEELAKKLLAMKKAMAQKVIKTSEEVENGI